MEPTEVHLACAGIGNNVSALLQGIELYDVGTMVPILVGVPHERIDGMTVTDVHCVLAFDVDPAKVGLPVAESIVGGANNYPRIVDFVRCGVPVEQGLTERDGDHDGTSRITTRLRESGANVLLLSLPTNRTSAARAYATAALDAGVAVVNCSADRVARHPDLLRRFARAGLPLLGDDLASQFGSSLIHRTLLDLLVRRGLQLDGTYQINLGGNEDFRNLRADGAQKLESKLNVLSPVTSVDSVTVIPSAGHVPYLMDRKVAHIRIEGRGWAGSKVVVDVRLDVQDSSNAAGVIIDLVRIAAARHRRGLGGFADDAVRLLKSPPILLREEHS